MKHNYERLTCWAQARALVSEIYRVSREFPGEERYGLTAQLRRSAISIPSNIAEGCGRGSNRALSAFLDIAIGSSNELETQLYLALDLGLIDQAIFLKIKEQVISVRKQIIGFKSFLLKSELVE